MKAVGPGDFMLGPGDLDPPDAVRAVIDQYLGTNYLWYPVAGNHELEQTNSLNWLRSWARAGIPHLIRRGPVGAEFSTYSFDFANSHFVALNLYYDGKSDSVKKTGISEKMMKWLEEDLTATRQPLVWVFGHKPIKSFPDMDTKRLRHADESVSTNAVQLARFMSLLKKNRVRAYLCGHTHGASIEKIDGLWQADSGHCRGAGDQGAPSTFLKFLVSGTQASVEVYRGDPTGQTYKRTKTVELD